MKQRRLCISVATRNRPKMLCDLFISLAKITRPEGVQVSFLMVENNSVMNLSAEIDQFQAMMPEDKIQYLLEPTIGISAARNRALNYGIEEGFDYLVFVDDDEIVDPLWLINLLKKRDELDLDLIGSPVRPTSTDPAMTLWQKIILSGLQRGEMRSERKMRRKCEQGKAGQIKVATGSWLGRLDFFRQTGLRFDSQFGLSGGEDWQLCAKAKSLGAKTGWAPEAIVYETVPLSRLNLSYYYRRDRDHNITEFGVRYRSDPKKTIRQLPVRLSGRLFRLLGTICTIPFRGGYGLVASARAAGGLTGIVYGVFGKNALHYAKTTGY